MQYSKEIEHLSNKAFNYLHDCDYPKSIALFRQVLKLIPNDYVHKLALCKILAYETHDVGDVIEAERLCKEIIIEAPSLYKLFDIDVMTEDDNPLFVLAEITANLDYITEAALLIPACAISKKYRYLHKGFEFKSDKFKLFFREFLELTYMEEAMNFQSLFEKINEEYTLEPATTEQNEKKGENLNNHSSDYSVPEVNEKYQEAYNLYVEQKDYRRAEGLCREVIEAAPDFYPVQVLLGGILIKMNSQENQAEAKAHILNAINKSPSLDSLIKGKKDLESPLYLLGTIEWKRNNLGPAGIYFITDMLLRLCGSSNRLPDEMDVFLDEAVPHDADFMKALLNRMLKEYHYITKKDVDLQ